MHSGIVAKGGGSYIIAGGNIAWDFGRVFPTCRDRRRLVYRCEGRRGGGGGGNRPFALSLSTAQFSVAPLRVRPSC